MKKLIIASCPFCGEIPDIDTIGTCIDITCCVSMGIQKSDHLSRDEWGQWNDTTFVYPEFIETKLFNIIVENWNTRLPHNPTEAPKV